MLQRRASGFAFSLTSALVARFIARNIVRALRGALVVPILLAIIALNLGERLLLLAFRVAPFGFVSRRPAILATLRRRRVRPLALVPSMLTLGLSMLLATTSLATWFVAGFVLVQSRQLLCSSQPLLYALLLQ